MMKFLFRTGEELNDIKWGSDQDAPLPEPEEPTPEPPDPEPGPSVPETTIVYDYGTNIFTQDPKIRVNGQYYSNSEWKEAFYSTLGGGTPDNDIPIVGYNRKMSTGSTIGTFNTLNGDLCLYIPEDTVSQYNYLKITASGSTNNGWSGSFEPIGLIINNTMYINSSDCTATGGSSGGGDFIFPLNSATTLSTNSIDVLSDADTEITPRGPVTGGGYNLSPIYANSVTLLLSI